MMTTDLPIHGGCACGNIRYTCTQLPLLMFQCHCRDCQRAVGGLFAANVWFMTDKIVFDTEPKSYVVKSDIGNTIHHEFCSDCGSPIGMWIEEDRTGRGLRASTLDDPAWLKPDADIFVKNAYPWEVFDPNRPKYQNGPPEELVARLAARIFT
jgi:hypothetical protein